MFVNNQVRAVKWHEWKLHYVYAPEAGAPPQPPLMRLFNLRSDPKEETDVKDANPWAQSVMDRLVDGVHGHHEAVPERAGQYARSVSAAEIGLARRLISLVDSARRQRPSAGRRARDLDDQHTGGFEREALHDVGCRSEAPFRAESRSVHVVISSVWPFHIARDRRTCVVCPIITLLRVSDPSSA